MDIWEANGISNAVTPHVCSPENSPCTTDADCGSGDGNRYKGFCDADGCDYNPYRMGNTTFYGPGKTVDTTKVFTVVTQFITSDGTDSGDLTEIRRLYVQDGKVYQQPTSNVAGISGNSITDSFCKAQKSVFGDTNYFATKGGMKGMGQAFKDGMVLVMSLWDDYTANMLWLDAPYPTTADPSKPGVSRGTCSTDSGKPADVESQQPGAKVIFSNIKTGSIGSTYSGALQPGGGGGGNNGGSSTTTTNRGSTTTTRSTSTTSRSTTTTTRQTTTTTAAGGGGGGTVAKYGQCGVSTSFTQHRFLNRLANFIFRDKITTAQQLAPAARLAPSSTTTTPSVCKGSCRVAGGRDRKQSVVALCEGRLSGRSILCNMPISLVALPHAGEYHYINGAVITCSPLSSASVSACSIFASHAHRR